MSRQVPRRQTWETVTFASGSLNPLQNHAACYHEAEDLVVVVGGRASSDTETPSTRWHALDLGASNVSSYAASDRIYGATVTVDPAWPQVLVFGGRTGTGRASGILLRTDLRNAFNGAAFEEIRAGGQKPAGRYDHAAAFDPTRGWMVVYGGATGPEQPIADSGTWVYDVHATAWTLLDGAWVGPRIGAVMVYDAHHGTVILAGGSTRGGQDLTAEVYYLDCPAVVTATPSVVASPSPTPSPTPTDAPPTSTPTDAPPTSTPSATASPVGLPATETPVPPATAIETDTPVPAPVPSPCRCFLPMVAL